MLKGPKASDLKAVRIAKHALSLGAEDPSFLQHIIALRAAHQCAHARGLVTRITNHGLGEAGAERIDHLLYMRRRGHDPADGGAFLPCFGGHLAVGLFDEQIKLGRAGGRISA